MVTTTRDGQFLETPYVLAGNDQQTVELGPTDHHDVLVDVLGNVASHTPRALADRPLRYGARATLQGQMSSRREPRRLAWGRFTFCNCSRSGSRRLCLCRAGLTVTISSNLGRDNFATNVPESPP